MQGKVLRLSQKNVNRIGQVVNGDCFILMVLLPQKTDGNLIDFLKLRADQKKFLEVRTCVFKEYAEFVRVCL